MFCFVLFCFVNVYVICDAYIGVGKFLRFVSGDSVEICLTDPKGACIVRWYNEGELRSEGSSITEGIGQGRITGQLGADNGSFRPDLALEVNDTQMLEALQRLQMIDGLMCGLSTGTNVAGAIEVSKKLNFKENNTIVTILCDSAFRYATKQFNIPFLESQNLPIPKWIDPDAIGNINIQSDEPVNPFANNDQLTQCLNDAII